LAWYDYGARNYDAAVPRLMNLDHLTEKYHTQRPVVYAENNPVMFRDINGMGVDGWDTDFVNSETGEKTHIEDGKDQVIAINTSGLNYMQTLYNSDCSGYNEALSKLENTYLNLNMTTSQFDEVVGTIYSEASVSANWEEAAGIYGVLQNRANAENTSIYDQISRGGVAGYAKRDQIFKPTAQQDRINRVQKGIAMSVATQKDYSNGAYWWDGTDFSNGGGYRERYLQGYKFTDSNHDLWNMGNNSVNGKMPFGTYQYKYESTNAIGNTIFSRKTTEYRRVENPGSRLYRSYP
jgi:hypothetical protein